MQRLKATRFDTIIVDNADASGAVMVLAAAKTLHPAKNPSVLCWQCHVTARITQGARSHMVLYCPLSAGRLLMAEVGASLRSEGEDARESHRRNQHSGDFPRSWPRRDFDLHYQPQQGWPR